MADQTSAIVDATDGHDDAVGVAAGALRDGKLVVVPTDTVYGVTADAFNPVATTAIFDAKHRQRRFPLPVLIRSPKQLMGLVTEVPEMAEHLMAAYWPGPLTLVVRADPNLAWDLGTNEGTVAVRMPMDDIMLDLIRAVGPLAVTSANLSGNPAATTVEMARSQLGDDVAIYVDGGRRVETKPSTIVDLTRAQPAILRTGPFDDDEVLAVARGEVEPHEASAPQPRHKPVSPGGPDDVTPADAAAGTATASTAAVDADNPAAGDAADRPVAVDHRAAAAESDATTDEDDATGEASATTPSDDDTPEPEPAPAKPPSRHVARDHRAG